MTYDEFLAQAEVNLELWTTIRRRAQVPEEIVERLRSLPGPRHLLVLTADWCGDAFNTVPFVAALADAVPQLDLRALNRDENLELMDRHLTGTSRSIPVVIVLDEEYRELGWWGPRPAALQRWVKSDEAQQMAKDDRYKEIRRWYARDQGRTTLAEIAELLLRPPGA